MTEKTEANKIDINDLEKIKGKKKNSPFIRTV